MNITRQPQMLSRALKLPSLRGVEAVNDYPQGDWDEPTNEMLVKQLDGLMRYDLVHIETRRPEFHLGGRGFTDWFDEQLYKVEGEEGLVAVATRFEMVWPRSFAPQPIAHIQTRKSSQYDSLVADKLVTHNEIVWDQESDSIGIHAAASREGNLQPGSPEWSEVAYSIGMAALMLDSRASLADLLRNSQGVVA